MALPASKSFPSIPVELNNQTMFVSGFNPDVDAGPEDVWPIPGLINFAANIGQVEIVSDAANDAFGGSGAEVIALRGIDDNFEEFVETVELNGTTPVLTTRSDYLHVQKAVVSQAGAGGENEGTVSMTLDGGVVNGITPTQNQSQSTGVIIPASDVPGREAHLLSVYAMVGKRTGAEATISMPFTIVDLDFESSQVTLTSTGGPLVLKYEIPVIFPAGTKIRVRVEEVAPNNALVSAGLQFAWYRPRQIQTP